MPRRRPRRPGRNPTATTPRNTTTIPREGPAKRRCLACGAGGAGDVCGACGAVGTLCDVDARGRWVEDGRTEPTGRTPEPFAPVPLVEIEPADVGVTLTAPRSMLGRMLGKAHPGFTWCLFGEPGAGKSTDGAAYAGEVARELGGRALYVSSEMVGAQVRDVVDRSGAAALFDFAHVDALTEEALDGIGRYPAAVLDSLSHVAQGFAQLRDMKRLVATANRAGTVLLVVLHANKDGKAAGALAVEHEADGGTVKYRKHPRRAELVKTRFSPAAFEVLAELDASDASAPQAPARTAGKGPASAARPLRPG